MGKVKVKRKVVVDPQLQFGLIKAFLFVFFASSLVFFITVMFIFEKLKHLFARQDIELHPMVAESFEGLQQMTSLVFGATFIASVVIVIYGGLFMSRRIAGPIESLKVHIDQLLAGDTVEKIQFRKGDYFTDLQDKFNQLLVYGRKDKNS